MQGKSYSTVQSAKRAIRKAGLQAMNVAFMPQPSESGRERVVPVIECENTDDAKIVESCGFKAKRSSPAKRSTSSA